MRLRVRRVRNMEYPGEPFCKKCNEKVDTEILEIMAELKKDSEHELENTTQVFTTTDISTQPFPPNQTEAEGLSGGGVAGIVIGVLLVLIISALVLFILYKRRLLPGRSRKQDTVIFSFDTSFQNLIDCTNISTRDPDSQSLTSSRASSIGRSSRSRPSSIPSHDDLSSGRYTSSSVGRSSGRHTTPNSGRYATPSSGRYTAPSSGRYIPNNPHQRPSTDYYAQRRLNYPTNTPTFIPGSTYNTQSRLNYNAYGLNNTPSSLYYKQRDYTTSDFYYRPSRHIDRQLMAYYNWAISEEPTEPGIALVHQPPMRRQ